MTRHLPTLLLTLGLITLVTACDNAPPPKAEQPEKAPEASPTPPKAEEPKPTPPPAPTYAIAPRGKDKRPMVTVPAGPFLRGNPPGTGKAEESPQKSITLDAFYIDRLEVTVDDYSKCVKAGACKSATFRAGKVDTKKKKKRKPESCNYSMPDRTQHPMNCVSWDGANAYCKWAGKRLPTEAEWEKAARGDKAITYPWGETKPTCEHACMVQNNMFGCGDRTTCPVGIREKGVSPYGALDMAGNVYEWVADTYDRGYFAKAPDSNPINKARSKERPIRGGSYTSDAEGVRATQRSALESNIRVGTTGFRCATE